MHDREIIWETTDGRNIKIIDMTSNHLVNVLKFIDKNIIAYESRWGKKEIKYIRYNIKQEIRLRKLNRIELNSNEEDLF